MEKLFKINQCWMHFVGGMYADHKKFVREVRKHGFSRRIPAQVARGMNFGDKILFLRWNKGKPFIFAEGRIRSLLFDSDIAGAIGQKLIEDGRATYSEGGGTVKRECGVYESSGTWTVEDVSMSELIDVASEAADGEKLFCMVGGGCIEAYDFTVFVHPIPKFTRGFIKVPSEMDSEKSDDDNRLIAVSEYHKQPKQHAMPKATRSKHQRAFAFA